MANDQQPVGDQPTGFEEKSVEELEALSRAEDEAAAKARLDARMAEISAKAEAEKAVAGDEHDGKVNLAGHWVGPADLIPCASAECALGCHGSGIVTVTRTIGPGQPGAGKPVLSREICACAIQGFLDRHRDDLKAIVTAPGIRMPKFRISKERDKVKARAESGDSAEARIARAEAEVRNLKAEQARIEDRINRRTEPHRKAAAKIAALGASVVRDAHGYRVVAEEFDGALIMAQEDLVALEGRLHEARRKCSDIERARAQAVEQANVADTFTIRYRDASTRVMKREADVRRRYRPELGPIEQKIDQRRRKIEHLRRVAGLDGSASSEVEKEEPSLTGSDEEVEKSGSAALVGV